MLTTMLWDVQSEMRHNRDLLDSVVGFLGVWLLVLLPRISDISNVIVSRIPSWIASLQFRSYRRLTHL